jgi:hypothetical protein
MEDDILAYCDAKMIEASLCDEESVLNTTIESSQVSANSGEIAEKLECDLMGRSKTGCFDIAAQMNLSFQDDNDISFNSSQGVAF